MALLRTQCNTTKTSGLENLLILTTFITVFSQLPIFVSWGITRYVCFPLWILLLFAALVTSKGAFPGRFFGALILAGAVFVVMGVNMLFSRKSYFSSSLTYFFALSVFLFALSGICAHRISARALDLTFTAYISATVLVAVDIWLEYIVGNDVLGTKIYAYGSKNSISTVIAAAIVLLMFRKASPKNAVQALRVAAVVFLLYMIVMLRSRATMLGLFAAFLLFFFMKGTSRQRKLSGLAIGAAALCVLAFGGEFSERLIREVLFAGREGSLDSISSGRIEILSAFPSLIRGNLLLGVGSLYYECFPLSAVLQFGLVAGAGMIAFALLPLFYSFRRRRTPNGKILFVLSVIFLLNSLLEGVAPYGPGTKCYLLWMLFGLLLVHEKLNDGWR